MSTAKSKDLFDESTMTFGEHLEALRIHLWRSIVWLSLCMIVTLIFGNYIMSVVKKPIDDALAKYNAKIHDENYVEPSAFKKLMGLDVDFGFGGDDAPAESQGTSGLGAEDPAAPSEDRAKPKPVTFTVNAHSLMSALHEIDPQTFQEPDDALKSQTVNLLVASDDLPGFGVSERQVEGEVADTVIPELQPVTLSAQEAFMTYLKVSFMAGLLLAAPLIFWELWLFVRAGLYPQERRYVHFYLPLCLGLFLVGAAFCFYAVFPFVLDFLLGFNSLLEVTPQIRLSEWLSFAIMMPVMFGLSFQLPLVMLVLERLSIFDVDDYRSKRRMAILVIAIVAMFMTPAEPMSMIMMMIPMVVLYEVGILLCRYSPAKSPFEEAEAA